MRKVSFTYSTILLLFAALFLSGCASTGNDDSHQLSAAESMPQDDESVSASPEPAVSEDSDPDTTGEEYQMDQEQYEETKRDLSELVSTLNSIIADEDYDEWLTYLTNEYISYYSDPEVLTELSRSPLLVKYNIKLRSLRDYFKYVVVASRRDVHIDDIKALDENKVKVYMIVNNEPIVVYTLERVDNRWKITK